MHISWNYPENKICVYGEANTESVNQNQTIQFNKIKNILYSSYYHIYCQNSFLNNNYGNINNLLEKDFKRISLSLNDDKFLDNPKYLFVSLYSDDSNEVKFGIFDNANKYNWEFKNMNIIHKNKYLSLSGDNKLVLSKNKCQWEITKNSNIKNVEQDLYLSCDLNYNIILTKDINDGVQFHFENDGIHYIKPKIIVDIEMIVLQNSIHIQDIYKITNDNINTCIGILLAAGHSSRFNSEKPKQLYLIDNIPVIMYSVMAMINCVYKLIIVTNNKCLEEIKRLTKYYDNIIILTNDEDCRLKTIEIGLEFIKNNHDVTNNKKIIIHDSARPFVKEEYIKKLINDDSLYSQYYLKLVNGLYKDKMLDRDQYKEICTPLVSNFDLFYFIFLNFMKLPNRIVYEHISILDLLKINYKLIHGNYNYLRKITFKEDLY